MDKTRFESHPVRSKHEPFLRTFVDELLDLAVFDATERSSPVLNWQSPDELQQLLDLQLKATADDDQRLLQLSRDIIRYSVKTGHPYFVNQLFSSVDPYALAGQWLTDALNPSLYTYEVAPVFSLMEETVLAEMRRIVGFRGLDAGRGDGIFCPGGSLANGYAISCARFRAMPEVKVSFRVRKSWDRKTYGFHPSPRALAVSNGSSSSHRKTRTIPSRSWPHTWESDRTMFT